MSTSISKLLVPVINRIILFGVILTLTALSVVIHKSSRVYLYQQAQCLLYYKTFDPSKIRPDFSIDEAFCKVSAIQSRLATIDGIDSFLSSLPRESSLNLVIYASPFYPAFCQLVALPVIETHC